MAQHDMDVANGSGYAVRSDINNALGALVSCNSGATAPATTFANMLWFDTTTNKLKKRNKANTGWIDTVEYIGTDTLAKFIGEVQITERTAETAPATDDEFLLYDASATALRKMTLANMLKVLNALTEDTTPDLANDFLLSYDASASAVKKIKPQTLGGPGQVTTIASGNLSGTNVTITNIPATFSYLALNIIGASMDTAARSVGIQLSTNNGSSYDTASNYVNSSATDVVFSAGSNTNAADVRNAYLFLFHHQGTGYPQFRGYAKDNAGTYSAIGGPYIGSTSAINALKILVNGGTGSFDAGTYSLLGIT